jgi:hypothetical protein
MVKQKQIKKQNHYRHLPSTYGVDSTYHCICSEIVNAITLTFSFFEGVFVGCVVGYFTKNDYQHKEEFAEELETGFTQGYKEGYWFSEL